jgi:hypothetical protein
VPPSRCAPWAVVLVIACRATGLGSHRPYLVAAADHPDNVLTNRDGRMGVRRLVPRERWRFVDHGTWGDVSPINREVSHDAQADHRLLRQSARQPLKTES